MNMKTIISIFLICTIFVTISATLLADEDSGQAAVPVSLELAKFVALDHAKQFYGDMGDLEFYDSEIYYDLNGNPAVYAIILVSSEVTVTSREQLKAKIASKYSDIESLRQQITPIKNQSISGKKKSQKIQNIHAQILQARKDLAGIEKFVTVICGADMSYVPVLKLFKGLPKHLTHRPFLLSKPGVRSSVRGNEVQRTFYLGMFDLAFEFGDSETTRQVQSANQIRKAIPKAEVKLAHSRTGRIITVRLIT
ncbi:unnamed protein product, partial [marine sediment metagenome]